MTPLPDPSNAGFTNRGKRQPGGARVGDAPRQPERGGRDAVPLEDLLGAGLVETEAQGQRVRRVTRHAEELADGRDVALAVGTEQPFRDVEHEIRAVVEQPLREILVGLEVDDLAQRAERSRDGRDRGRIIPLDVEVWLYEVGAERPTGRLAGNARRSCTSGRTKNARGVWCSTGRLAGRNWRSRGCLLL